MRDGTVKALQATLEGRALAAFLARQAACQTCAESALSSDLAPLAFPYRYRGTDRSLPIIAGRTIDTAFKVSEGQACPDPEATMRLNELCAKVTGAA